MELVSVIIPTKNRPIAVVDAVRSVFDGDYQHFEIFVIDQSDGEETRIALEQFDVDPRFQYQLNRRPGYGAASSRNIGIALSSGEILGIIDDDVVVCKDWMSKVVAEFENDPDLDFICGKLTAPTFDWREGFTPNFDPSEITLSKWQMPVMAAGANFSMRRNLLKQVGGYDELCGPGSGVLIAADDGDISYRIMRSGAKWKALSSIEVVHKHGFRAGVDGAALLKRYQREVGGNYGRFFRRGDFLGALWFIQWQLKDLWSGVCLNLLRGRKPQGAGWIVERLIGFGLGFRLPPNLGFVTGDDLEVLRKKLLGIQAVEKTNSTAKNSN